MQARNRHKAPSMNGLVFDRPPKTVALDNTRAVMPEKLLSSLSLIQDWEENGDAFKKLVEYLSVLVCVYQYPRVLYA